jgi:polyhydroxybutyrate depolymerase
MARVRRVAPVAAWGAVTLSAACGQMFTLHRVDLFQARAGRTTFHALRVGTRERTYLLHLPPAARDSALPLLLVFHGNHANASTVRSEAKLEHVTDPLGIAVAYLNGSGKLRTLNLTWNDGSCCGYARAHHVDDGAFARALVDTLARAVHADPRRVYLAGLSAGGTLVLSLACGGDTLYNGVVSVGGTMPVQRCEPRRRVPIMFMRGAGDTELPRDHLENARLGAQPYATSFAASRAFWAAFDGCASAGAVDTTKGAIITRATGCPADLDAQEVVVLGQGHAWPGGKKPWLLAPRPARYDAAALIMQFFVDQHAAATSARR